jgi:hypothetical protein
MSARGATISQQAPTHVPIRPVVWLVAMVVAIGIALGAVAATTDAPALDQSGVVDRFDWSQQLAHPRLGDRGVDRPELTSMPEQRLYPDGFDRERRIDGPDRVPDRRYALRP